MNPELLYGFLVHAAWLFLGGWLLALMAACAIEFRGEWSFPPGEASRLGAPQGKVKLGLVKSHLQ